jgi:hypothetical protein
MLIWKLNGRSFQIANLEERSGGKSAFSAHKVLKMSIQFLTLLHERNRAKPIDRSHKRIAFWNEGDER